MRSTNAKKPALRRTQQARREGTIRKLLDSATDALIELGYGGATIQEISARSGVSQGGLFRHFATREALMVAVGEDVGRKLLARYETEFRRLKDHEDPLELSLRLVRQSCRSRINQAWYELSIAARTNDNLRRALKPTATRYHDAIERLARDLMPELAERVGGAFPILVDTIIAVFDGEMVRRFVLKTPDLEESRIALLNTLLGPLARSAVS